MYFVKAQTVNACVQADGCREKTREYNLKGKQKTHEYELMDSQKTDEYELMDSQKTDAHKLMDSQKTDAYKLMDSQKTDAYDVTAGFAKTFRGVPCVFQMLGGPLLRLGIPVERPSIPSGTG